METRQLIAYLLIAVIVGALFAAYWYASRERRAHNRGHRAAVRRARERIEDAAEQP
jgi:Flp pilus assembly protein TadB